MITRMPQPANLTEGLAHLRDRKLPKRAKSSELKSGNDTASVVVVAIARERRMATDYFSLFVYTLLGVAIFSQLLLIIWQA
jgi:hypothetical protein